MVSHNYKIDSDNKNANAGVVLVVLVLLYGGVGECHGCHTVKLKFECLESLYVLYSSQICEYSMGMELYKSL